MAHSDAKFCPSCDSFTDGKKETRGHFAMEVLLWLCFLLPGFIYSIWRQTSKHMTCSHCGAGNLISFNSPKAKKELGQDYERNLADFVAHRKNRRNEILLTVVWLGVGVLVAPLFIGFFQVYPKTTLLLTALGAGFYFFKKKKAVKS